MAPAMQKELNWKPVQRQLALVVRQSRKLKGWVAFDNKSYKPKHSCRPCGNFCGAPWYGHCQTLPSCENTRAFGIWVCVCSLVVEDCQPTRMGTRFNPKRWQDIAQWIIYLENLLLVCVECFNKCKRTRNATQSFAIASSTDTFNSEKPF